MIPKQIRINRVFPVLAVLLFGCSISPQPEPTVTGPAPNCRSRNESDIGFTDLGLKDGSAANTRVAALTFTPDGNSLLIAYVFDPPDLAGQLVQVQISDNHLLRSTTLGRLTLGLTHFTEDAEMIISAAPKTCTKKLSPDDTCWDDQAWNTTTGQSLGLLEGFNTNLRDIAVSGDGKWLLKAKLVNTITSFDPQLGGISFAESFEGVHREVVAGALNEHGNWVALGIKDETYDGKKRTGSVRLEKWDGQRLDSTIWTGWRFGPKDLTGDGIELDGVPLRLAFDSSDRWLAAQTDRSIYLFDVPSLGVANRRVDFPRSTLGVLRFNPIGSLLAGDHGNGIRILSVPDLSVKLDKQGVATTSIAFSPDGCLLAWGDIEGTVHIINSPTR